MVRIIAGHPQFPSYPQITQITQIKKSRRQSAGQEQSAGGRSSRQEAGAVGRGKQNAFAISDFPFSIFHFSFSIDNVQVGMASSFWLIVILVFLGVSDFAWRLGVLAVIKMENEKWKMENRKSVLLTSCLLPTAPANCRLLLPTAPADCSCPMVSKQRNTGFPRRMLDSPWFEKTYIGRHHSYHSR